MDTCYELCPRAITLIVLLEKLARFFIQSGVRVRVDEQALDGNEDVRDAVRRLPVLLERVHADVTRGGHVRVEDLRGEPAYTGIVRNTLT